MSGIPLMDEYIIGVDPSIDSDCLNSDCICLKICDCNGKVVHLIKDCRCFIHKINKDLPHKEHKEKFVFDNGIEQLEV